MKKAMIIFKSGSFLRTGEVKGPVLEMCSEIMNSDSTRTVMIGDSLVNLADVDGIRLFEED